MKKFIFALIISLLSLNSFATEVVATFKSGWARIVYNTEEKTFKIQNYSTLEKGFVTKFSVENVFVDSHKDNVQFYTDSNKETLLGEIKNLEEREIGVSTLLYKNQVFKTSDYENIDVFFDFASLSIF